ncbi:hypothetical protein ACS5PK_21690 [Roseateles sp. DB2]|uniref:hypothetical protein n=1 Tax=Roseateles sp. DB2 TaxID=3453717 RepID=UPI003EEA318E
MNIANRWVLALVIVALGAWVAGRFTADPQVRVVGAPASAGPSLVAGPPPTAASSDGGRVAPPLQGSTTAAPSTAARQRSYAELIRRFPGGLQTEAQQALRAGDGARASEVARELGTCQSWAELREALERTGKQALLAQRYPEVTSSEQPRLDAFCQTAGPHAQELQDSLLLMAARQGLPDAVYWAHEMEKDPSGSASRLIGRWAMEGKDLRALRAVIYGMQPELFGLRMDDQNVARMALVLLAQTPEYADRQGVVNAIQLGQEIATYQRAGVGTKQAYEQLLTEKPPPVRFSELKLSPGDEHRAQAIVEALVRERRRQLTKPGP